jgi:bifunctional enzyme CysN/CysC/sulfate adenylyltransferase subunit 1
MPHTQHPVEILRFNTCGSVDDGKSTLIGRLLYDSKSLMEDQLDALERSADITGGGQINLANLTDGLRAEREQGITIDVAYRYFATPKRKFIVAATCNTPATWSRALPPPTCPSCWWTRGRA